MRDSIYNAMKANYENSGLVLDMKKMDYETVNMLWSYFSRKSTVEALRLMKRSNPLTYTELQVIATYTRVLESFRWISEEIRPLDETTRKKADNIIKDLLNDIKIDEYLDNKEDDDEQ